MNINSNGQLTDMHLVGADTQCVACRTDEGDYTLVFTPSNPLYYSGNYIVFSQAFLPCGKRLEANVARCREIFLAEFTARYRSNSATLSHIMFTWDVPEHGGNLLEDATTSMMCADERFEVEQVLSRQGYADFPVDIGYTFREIDSTKDCEWEQLVQFKIGISNCKEAEHYQRPRYAFYRALVSEGKGKWFGAYDGKQLVASFGIFTVTHDGSTIARFQEVDTLSNYRRQGICRNLIRYAIRQFDEQTSFCIITDAGSDAERVYRKVGFEPTERLYFYREMLEK